MVEKQMPENPWVAGEFAIKCHDGNASAYDETVAGWLKGIFAIDFRVFLEEDDDNDYRKGWVLTHLPTGMICAKMGCPRLEAFRWADEIAALPGWDTITPERCTRPSL